jgi:hypothetical protein
MTPLRVVSPVSSGPLLGECAGIRFECATRAPDGALTTAWRGCGTVMSVAAVSQTPAYPIRTLSPRWAWLLLTPRSRLRIIAPKSLAFIVGVDKMQMATVYRQHGNDTVMLERLGLALTLVSAEGDQGMALGLPEGSTNPTVTRAPGAFDCTAAYSAMAFSITRSSTLVTSEPLGSPATAAGLPLITPTTLAPSASFSSPTCAPNQACDAAPVAMSSPVMRAA